MPEPAHTPFLVGLVGTGVGPSLTPALHMAEGRAHGLDYVYRTIDLNDVGVAPERIGEILTWARALGYDALNVTHPCKKLVIPHLDAVDAAAAALGAVNTVVFEADRTVGYNTDAPGFATGFAEGLPGAATDDVVLLGAGGAGAAVGHALLELGTDHLTVVDLDVDRATALAGPAVRPASECPRRRVGVRQTRRAATPRRRHRALHAHGNGRASGPAPRRALLHPGLWVADIVYRPFDTALLTAARDSAVARSTAATWPCIRPTTAFELITGPRAGRRRMSRHFRSLVR